MDHTAIQKALRGRYRIERELGRGGMGVVYQAFQDSQQRRVALKLVSTDLVDDLDWAARLAQEARLAARIAHPNVVKVYEFDQLGELWAMIVFELVEGESLRSLLEHEAPLSPARARELGSGLAAGLDAIHAAGILHRDLKPENVLLSEHGPKITDLGIAKDLAGDKLRTSSGMMLGTPPYMAPEHIQGAQPYTGALDVYALGCVLFEMVTGQLPFQAPTVSQLLLAHVNERPPNPSSLHGGIPADLSSLILACLEKRPANRPTAAQLAERLTVADGAPDTPVPRPATGALARPEAARPAGSRSSATAVLPGGVGGASSARVPLSAVPSGTVPVKQSVVYVAAAPPPGTWRRRLAALLAGGLAAACALRMAAPLPRGHLALPPETIATAARGLDRARRAALPPLLARLTHLLLDRNAVDLRQLAQAVSDRRTVPHDGIPDPVSAFFNEADHAGAVRTHALRVAEHARMLQDRYLPAELGLDGLRAVTDGLVLHVEFVRLWTHLLDDTALLEALAYRRTNLARLAEVLKMAPPARLTTELRTMRTLVFTANAPPVEPAMRALFAELTLADSRPLPEFEKFQTCWRMLSLLEEVSEVDCSSETVVEPFLERVRPAPEVLQRDIYAAALMAATAAGRPRDCGYQPASIAFGKSLSAARREPVYNALWQSVVDLGHLYPFPFSVPRALEGRPRI